MKTLISMLRGINVSGQNTIRMVELAKLYESLGLERVTTYVQSGNIVFNTAEPDVDQLAAVIQSQIAQVFGYSVTVWVRSVDYFAQVAAGNPFAHQRQEDPAKLHITFLQTAPAPEKWAELRPPAGETDELAAGDLAVYLFCPNGYGRTKLSNTFFEKKLGVPATTRNWKTVQALLQMGLEQTLEA